MNALVLTLGLIVLTFLFLLFSNGDIFAPSVLMSGSYLSGSLIVFLHNGFSEYDITEFTVMLVITFVILFSIGFYILAGSVPSRSVNAIVPRELVIGKRFTIFSDVLVIISIIRIIYVYRNLTGIRFSFANISSFIWNGKYTADSTGFSNGIFWGLVILFSYVIQYVFAYACIYDKIIKRKKIQISKMVPIFLSFICETIQGGRIWLIQFIIYVLFIIYVFLQKKKAGQSNYYRSFKFLLWMIESVALFWIVFTLMGRLKFQHYKKPFDTFYGYTGASYLVFEGTRKIASPVLDLGESYTLTSFYSFLNHFGFNISLKSKVGDLYTFMETGKGLVSNIMPGFGRYYFDFGYIGMLTVGFVLGLFCGSMYKRLRRRYNTPTFIFLYATIIQSTALQFISEQFLLYMLSVSFLIPIVEFYIAERLLMNGIKTRFRIKI